MIIKPAEGRLRDVDALNELLARPDVDADLRKRIQTELRRVQAGARGERDAAYEIDFHYAASPNVMLIHDLRLEVDGRVAQIDHLIIDRLVEICVLESKHFSEGVAVDEFGEWVGFYQHRPFGIGSPIEQNRKHVLVLGDAFKKRLVQPPKRLGIAIKPRFRSLVVISKGARITRPKSKAAQARIEGLDTVIKIDQLRAQQERDWEQRGIANLPRVAGKGEIERLARQLVALHRPITIDWAARFGLPALEVVAPEAEAEAAAPDVEVDVAERELAVKAEAPTLEAAAPEPETAVPETDVLPAKPGGRSRSARSVPVALCQVCAKRVSQAVVDFCEERAEVFASRILCMDCQRLARRGKV
jgi:hypothetical protein